MELIIIITMAIVSVLVLNIFISNKKNMTEVNIILFPYWMKFLGFGILIICSIAPSVYQINENDFLSNLRNFIVIIGLLIIVLSKEKVENEMLNRGRYYSFVISFVAGAIAYQIFALFDLSEKIQFNSSYFLGYILILYILLFYSFKRKFNR